MPVPFGFGVSDFVAVGTLAWNVYKSCKAAAGSFDNISVEVLSLQAILKECEETVFTRPFTPERKERLVVIKAGCDKVLRDLQSLVDKYESLGTQSKRTWDRMKWPNEEIVEIRARLTSNVTLLTAYISTSQQCIETKLEKLVEEFQQGKREESIISHQTIDSLSTDDRTQWRNIRKELEGIGIDLAAFEANRSFILGWLARAVETGAFDEQNTRSLIEKNNDSDEQESQGNKLHDDGSSSPQIVQSNIESFDRVTQNQSSILRRASQSAHGVKDNIPKPAEMNKPLPETPETFEEYSDSDEQEPLSDEEHYKHSNSPQIVQSKIESPDKTTENHLPILQMSPQSTHGVKDRRSKPAKTFEDVIASGQQAPRTPVPRGVAFLAGIARPKLKFIAAVSKARIFKALNILRDEALFQLLGSSTLNWALWISCQHDHRLLSSELVERGADVNWTGEKGTPLWHSVANGSYEIVRLLLENGANANYMGPARTSGESDEPPNFAPREAVKRKDFGILRLLLSFDYCCEVSLIHEAASFGDVLAIKILLDYGANIDAVSPDHGTALMLALCERRKAAAVFLLAKGANPNFQSVQPTVYHPLEIKQRWYWYRTPIEAAVRSGSPSMTSLLLDRGVVPDGLTLSHVQDMINSTNDGMDTQELDDWKNIEKLLQGSRKAGGH